MTKLSIAAIDPAVFNTITVVATLVAPILLAWIAYKTAVLSKKSELLDKKTDNLDVKIKEVEKASNGMQAALLVAGARANLAEGKEQGRNAQKLEDQATAIGRELAARVPVASGEAANTAKVAEIIAVVDTNVRAVDKKVEVIDENVKEVHETVVKQTEIKTKS